MNQWTTEVCSWQGNVYTREVGPNDTTVYCDHVYAAVPYITTAHGKVPNDRRVKQEISFAEEMEQFGEVRKDHFK